MNILVAEPLAAAGIELLKAQPGWNVIVSNPKEYAAHLAEARVNVWNGHNYAWELTGVLGIRDSGSAVRAGLVHYNDRSDVDRLLASVAELAG